jgi:TPR repeat protein
MKRYILFFICFLASTSALAEFEQAFAAAQAGDHVAAFQGFREAAEAGDVRAFGHLAGMYLYGQGTARDYGQAYVWFGLAMASGDQYAAKFQRAAASMLRAGDLPALERQIADLKKRLNIGPRPTAGITPAAPAR